MPAFRDHFKDEAYFKDFTIMLRATLEKSRAKMHESPKPFPMEHYALADGLSSYISGAYSRGLLVRNLAVPCAEMLEHYALCVETDTSYKDGGGLIYQQLLEMVAIGVLLDTKDALRTLCTKLAEVGYKDYLINFLFLYAEPGYELTEKLLWPRDKACLKLKDITKSGKDEAANGLLEYLDKIFYTKANQEDDYDSHKKGGYAYQGYWSFEAAAIAKIMNLDDTKLKGSLYYPYDMVHGDAPDTPEDPMDPLSAPEPEPFPSRKKIWWKFW